MARADPDGLPPIEDYALLGDCHAAALVSKDGSIDWCCLHRFDQRPIFTRLLDARIGGAFRIAPEHAYRASRRYRPGTFVLETAFDVDGGRLVVVDCLVHAHELDDPDPLPAMELVRIVRCERGRVRARVVMEPRFDYGLTVPRAQVEDGAILVYGGSAALVVESDLELALGEDEACLTARVALRAGDERFVRVRSCEPHRVDARPIGPDGVRGRVAATERFFRDWSDRCRAPERHHAAVVRSALVLKALSNWPTGALVAAPTTSLPELPGGVRNWDYRFTWLRDSDLHLDALFRLGYRDEAHAYLAWLKRTTAGRASDLQVCYGVGGERLLPEIELPHLAGYRGARPVRIGNDAARQFQLGSFGHVLEAAWDYHAHGGEIDRGFQRFLRDVVDHVCACWREPDSGIWEVRGAPRHFATSKLLAWVTVDRGIRLARELGFAADLARWRALRAEIRRDVETRGVDPRTGALLRAYDDARELDASALLFGIYGFLEARDPRMLATIDALERRLGRWPHLYRYRGPDGLPGDEGAFFAVSCWMVNAEARAGRLDDAHARFEALLGCANDVGLIAEEIDPANGAHLGNFPQALSHIGLIHAALALDACERGRCDDA